MRVWIYRFNQLHTFLNFHVLLASRDLFISVLIQSCFCCLIALRTTDIFVKDFFWGGGVYKVVFSMSNIEKD